MKTHHYIEEKAPPEFIQAVIWWACQDALNNPQIALACGARDFALSEKDLSQESRQQIVRECDAFWCSTKQTIADAKGRTGWSPDVDTHENHISNSGTNFYFARKGNSFFIERWPDKEKREFIKAASAFKSLILEAKDGQLFIMPC